jgi:hypothetical protein
MKEGEVSDFHDIRVIQGGKEVNHDKLLELKTVAATKTLDPTSWRAQQYFAQIQNIKVGVWTSKPQKSASISKHRIKNIGLRTSLRMNNKTT